MEAFRFRVGQKKNIMKRIQAILILFFVMNLVAETSKKEANLQLADILQKQTGFAATLQRFAEKNSHTLEGQKTYLELAKISILRRNYAIAIKNLQKINHAELTEKHFWLAKSYLEIKKFHRAIISAQNFITSSENNDQIEIAYFLIAESYIKQEMYKRALNTLETLRKSKYINNNIPFLHYKMGNCYELMGKNREALQRYKKIKKDFPHTLISFLAEEKIDEIITQEKKLQEIIAENALKKDENELKIYLQVGAFNSKENAENYQKIISSYGYQIDIFPKIKNNKKLFIVAVGPFNEENKLKKVSAELKQRNIESFILKRY